MPSRTAPSLTLLNRILCALATVVAFGLTALAQITPSQDAYTNTATPTTNFGAKTLLDVQSASQNTYIQFDLSSIPSGYTGSNIAKATLKLYVNTVPAAGSFNVDFVNGTWDEKTITANILPALGTTIAASIPLSSTNVKDYVLIDVTPALQAWLNGTQPNDGIALVANGSLNATFDSKEATTQSHPPELDVVFASSGGGGITGINTANGSGLIGGGNSGTLNLSLTNACAANQVLKWSGSAWSCANLTSGGTVTSVGLSAPVSDFTVTGSPVTTAGTLGLNWAVAPTNGNVGNTIVKRDSAGGFASGLINASIATDTDLSTTITGFQLGATKETFGVFGYAASPHGVGVFGRGVGFSATSSIRPPLRGTGVWGDTSALHGTAVYATVDDGFAVQAIGSGTTVYTMAVFNANTQGPIFFAQNGSGGSCSIEANGDLFCSGSINGSAKNFRLDHPLDPANKYLTHTSIESSEMLNLYTGNAVLGADGSATVSLPDWFTALNRDFRYQLTPIGGFAPLYIAEELSDNHFVIAGGRAGMKVSWQVTGVRHDAYANANPLKVEQDKGKERGHYLHPELFGATPEQSVGWDHSRLPRVKSSAKETGRSRP
ncbi:MAG: DNRLRE domain-containing protein [Acidobacteria bacterium]|nr:DNRLRE domain-containing protein [Acidobacteriota bacterium]